MAETMQVRRIDAVPTLGRGNGGAHDDEARSGYRGVRRRMRTLRRGRFGTKWNPYTDTDYR